MAEASTVPYDFSSFWQAADLSDVSVVLTDEGSGGAFVEELAGHGVVLAAASPVFKAQLTRWRGQQETTAPQKPSNSGRTRSCCSIVPLFGCWRRQQQQTQQPLLGADSSATAAGSSSKPCITVDVSSPAEAEAAKAFIQFIYTRTLPGTAWAEQLLAILQLADKYDVQSCAVACCDALSKRLLDWDTLLLVLQLPPAYSEAPLFGTLFSKAGDQLQQELGDLEVAWASKQGRERFLALPLKGVELLLGDKRTKVAYENTVLVALTLWVQHHSDSLAAGDKRRLARLIRLPYVTPLFASGVTPILPWLVEALGMKAVAAGMGAAAVLATHTYDQRGMFDFADTNGWPLSWAAGRRPRSAMTEAKLEWKVPLKQLKLACATKEEPRSPFAVTFGGLQWRMSLCRPSSNPLTAAIVHSNDSSFQLGAGASGVQAAVAIVSGSITALRPASEAPAAAGAAAGAAAVSSDKVHTFRSSAPCTAGVAASDLWGVGTMASWDPQRFKSWQHADGMLRLQMKVTEFM